VWAAALLALSAASAALWLKSERARRLRLDALALISGGAAVMFLVDSAFSYAEGGPLFETGAEAVALSAALVLSALAIWGAILARARLVRRAPTG